MPLRERESEGGSAVKLGNDNCPASEPLMVAAQPKAANLPPGLLPGTPDEHRRRGDAADALRRTWCAGLAAMSVTSPGLVHQ